MENKESLEKGLDIYVSDSTLVIFSSDSGTLNPQTITLTKDIAKTTFISTKVGFSIIKATIDMQVQTNITSKRIITKLIVDDVTGFKNKTVNLTAKLINQNKKPLTGKKVSFKVNGNVVGTVMANNNGIEALKYRITENKGS